MKEGWDTTYSQPSEAPGMYVRDRNSRILSKQGVFFYEMRQILFFVVHNI